MAKKILLIEDMKGVRESLEVILSLAGYDVHFASNGAEGLQKSKDAPYDLILTDILMPELDGTEVIFRLCASFAKEKATDILEKPFSRDELLEKVNSLLH